MDIVKMADNFWDWLSNRYKKKPITELEMLERIHGRLGWIMFWIISGTILIIMTLGSIG